MNKTLLSALLLLLVSTNGQAQLQSQLISEDASPLMQQDFIQLNGKERIDLAPLYDPNFALYLDYGVEQQVSNDSVATENAVSYTRYCRVSPVEIVDSIDLNGDGVKELFVLRQSECSVSPSNLGPYGEGGQRHSYVAYEVWDVKRKQQLFQVRNIRESQVAVSTNVVQTFGYRFQVTIDEKGCFHISGSTGSSGYEPGTYTYSAAKGGYVKE
jgi:hypothetical protein